MDDCETTTPEQAQAALRAFLDGEDGTDLGRWLGGEGVADMAEHYPDPDPDATYHDHLSAIERVESGLRHEVNVLRAALKLYRAQHLALERDAGQLSDAWAELVTLLTELGRQSAAISGMHYETHVADEWVAGHIIGEALTWRHVCSMLTMVVNAAHLRKAAVTGQSGSEASGKAAVA